MSAIAEVLPYGYDNHKQCENGEEHILMYNL